MSSIDVAGHNVPIYLPMKWLKLSPARWSTLD